MSSLIKDDLEIIGILKGLMQQKTKLWCWQDSSESGKRIVQYAIIQKVDPIKKVFYLRPNTKLGFKFTMNVPIFILANARAVAFSFYAREIGSQFIITPIPSKVTLVTGEYLDKISLVEKEDELANSHLRQVVRRKFESGKIIGVRRLNDLEEVGILSFFTLYDISSGGMGFCVQDPSEFNVDERIVVESLDGICLAKKIILGVKSVRQINDLEFKVGCQYIEG